MAHDITGLTNADSNQSYEIMTLTHGRTILARRD